MNFDHRQTGTDEQLWRAHADLVAASSLPRPSAETALTVLAAHPDDESLGAGGLIAAAARAGAPVCVVVATDGDASHPNSPTHRPARLAAMRRREVTAAISELAPQATVVFLGLPDGGLDARTSELDSVLGGLVGAEGWLIAPWRGDRHADHEACGAAAARVSAERPGVRLLEYPIWAWHWARPPSTADSPATMWQPDGPAVRRVQRFVLDDQLHATKQRALACHSSQTEPLSPAAGDEAILPAGVLAHFTRSFETFVIADPAAAEADYFDRLYGQTDDPWGLADRFYETRKRALLLASLPRERFRRVFEPGCATGLLTELLAGRADEVVATDGAERAVRQARARVSDPRVHVSQARIPDDWPAGEFDLIVISEVGYYCPDLDRLRARIEDSLAADGVLIACHWRHPAPDHPHDAEAVHAALGAGLVPLVRHLEADFRLEVWSRSGESPARTEGILG